MCDICSGLKPLELGPKQLTCMLNVKNVFRNMTETQIYIHIRLGKHIADWD